MEGKKKRGFRFPVWAKTLVVLILSVATISVVAVVISANNLRRVTREHYIQKATELADTLVAHVDHDKVLAIKDKVYQIYQTIPEDERVENSEWGSEAWETYLHKFDEVGAMPEYTDVLSQIHELHEVNNALYMYISYADINEQRMFYLVDDSDPGDPADPHDYDDQCRPGTFDYFTEQDKGIVSHLDTGFLPEITNMPEYGYLVSIGRPLYYNETDNTYICGMVELSMNEIVAEENNDIRNLSLILAALGLGVAFIGYLMVLLVVVRPIRILTKTANEYTEGNNDNLDKFAKVKIRTKDEIEDLANSMKKMEADINHYIDDLLSTTTKLEGAEKKADELKYIADRDALTGLMNKRAYFEKEERLNIDIKKGKAKFAVSMIDLNDLKVTNDTQGHEKGDILIVAVSNIIKKVFALSSVYRIGGDEFVVISENEDYKNIQKLKNLFIAIINQSMNDEIKVSAAIGIAIFNPKEDNNVEDVFKRADIEMYKMKKEMKSK